jgi:hypothetical protein
MRARSFRTRASPRKAPRSRSRHDEAGNSPSIEEPSSRSSSSSSGGRTHPVPLGSVANEASFVRPIAIGEEATSAPASTCGASGRRARHRSGPCPPAIRSGIDPMIRRVATLMSGSTVPFRLPMAPGLLPRPFYWVGQGCRPRFVQAHRANRPRFVQAHRAKSASNNPIRFGRCRVNSQGFNPSD